LVYGLIAYPDLFVREKSMSMHIKKVMNLINLYDISFSTGLSYWFFNKKVTIQETFIDKPTLSKSYINVYNVFMDGIDLKLIGFDPLINHSDSPLNQNQKTILNLKHNFQHLKDISLYLKMHLLTMSVIKLIH
jgi:hypothetical protein